MFLPIRIQACTTLLAAVAREQLEVALQLLEILRELGQVDREGVNGILCWGLCSVFLFEMMLEECLGNCRRVVVTT